MRAWEEGAGAHRQGAGGSGEQCWGAKLSFTNVGGREGVMEVGEQTPCERWCGQDSHPPVTGEHLRLAQGHPGTEPQL